MKRHWKVWSPAVTGEMNSASVRNALQSAVYLPIVMVLSTLAISLVLVAVPVHLVWRKLGSA